MDTANAPAPGTCAPPPGEGGNPLVCLVLGGAASGKSAFAEQQVATRGLEKIYIATGTAGDDEMAQRIARHRARRGQGWTTLEETLALADALAAQAGPGRAVLIDCLTLWLANVMAAGRSPETEGARLAAALAAARGPVTVVANEVGQGIVPVHAETRRFRDHAGLLNRKVAAVAGRVLWVVAGLPQILKQPETGEGG